MPKKKRTLKHHRERAAVKRSFIPNPGPAAMALVEEALPAFAGYAGGRFVGRVAMKVAGAKLGKHAAPLASTALAALAYFLAHRIKKISKYSSPLVVGSTIAALQAILQAYLPKYAWLISDPSLAEYAAVPHPKPALSDYENTKQNFLRPVGDEFDKYEREAMNDMPSMDGPPPPQAAGPKAHTAPAAQPVNIDPNEWDVDPNFNADDFGSLSGGLSN